MKKRLSTIIIGTGNYLPSKKIFNEYFLKNKFYDKTKNPIKKSNQEIVSKFKEITGISERRYVINELTSEIGFLAAKECLESANFNAEKLNYLIFAHNFGDIENNNCYGSQVPNLASRVKEKLKIKNSKTEAFDIIFGCPGWLQGIILADRFFHKKNESALIIGAETLSKIRDSSDIDSMLYSDGAGATLLKSIETNSKGILAYSIDCGDSTKTQVMRTGKAYKPNTKKKPYFKMETGHDVFKYAITKVPEVIKESLDKAKLHLEDISKIFIHQANKKMDESILKNLFKLYKLKLSDRKIKEIMPMTISYLGNNSVATIPIMLDLVLKEKIKNQKIKPGENIILASIGAGGPNINSLIYKIP